MDTLPPQRLPQVVGNYPLEAGLAAWGIFIGISSVLTSPIGAPPSGALTVLPPLLGFGWSVLMVLGSLNLVVALSIPRLRRSPMVARSMFLYGTVFLVYAIAIEVNTGFIKGGAVAGLMLMLGVVCFLRSRYLRRVYEVLVAEAHRTVNGHGENRESGEDD